MVFVLETIFKVENMRAEEMLRGLDQMLCMQEPFDCL